MLSSHEGEATLSGTLLQQSYSFSLQSYEAALCVCVWVLGQTAEMSVSRQRTKTAGVSRAASFFLPPAASSRLQRLMLSRFFLFHSLYSSSMR